MPFEVLALPYSWVHKQGPSSRFNSLRNLVNASYDKPRYKFGIIKSPRVKSNETILSDFSIDMNDEICFYLLLGTQQVFDSFYEKDGYVRDLSQDTLTTRQVFTNDIPERYYSTFDLDEIAKSDVVFVDDDFEFTDDLLNRCIASVGLRSFHGDSKPRVKEFELTAFTSFMRNTGPKVLDFVISKCLLDSGNFAKLSRTGGLSDFDSIVIHADVIREHGLVDYYIKKCSFEKSSRPDVVVRVNQNMEVDADVFEEGVLASQDFHIAFLHRQIDV
ncbi:RMD6 Sporulation protein RMD6 [Candida maltosa Xu316]